MASRARGIAINTGRCAKGRQSIRHRRPYEDHAEAVEPLLLDCIIADTAAAAAVVAPHAEKPRRFRAASATEKANAPEIREDERTNPRVRAFIRFRHSPPRREKAPARCMRVNREEKKGKKKERRTVNDEAHAAMALQ